MTGAVEAAVDEIARDAEKKLPEDATPSERALAVNRALLRDIAVSNRKLLDVLERAWGGC